MPCAQSALETEAIETVETIDVATASGRANLSSEDRNLEPESLMPTQFFANPDWRDLAPGEVALRRAVLEDAIECLRTYAASSDVHERRLAKQAERWLFRDPPEAPFSFQSVCEAIGVDPVRLRRRLTTWRWRRQLASGGAEYETDSEPGGLLRRRLTAARRAPAHQVSSCSHDVRPPACGCDAARRPEPA